MKGRGKGDNKSSGGGDQSSADGAQEIKDCPLTFPDLRPVDHTRVLPRYTSVLGRSEDENVGVEELDTLQTELENLLAAVAKRMMLLKKEIDTLTSWQSEKGGPTSKSKPGKVQPDTSPAKRGGKNEERSTKKFKDSTGKAVPSPTPKPKGKVQKPTEAERLPESPRPSPAPSDLPKVPKAKTDVPNRFWAMVEPYTTEITTDDLKVLEELMKTHEDDADYYKIPSLGKHYAQKWAQDDLLEEQREGNKPNEKRGANASGGGGDASAMLRRLEDSDDETSPFGPLTQRLIQALMEENIMTPIDDNISEADAAEAASISPRSLAKQLKIGNTANLERRIKKELEENGILEVDDRTSDDNPEDEILQELRKKQQELKALSQHNAAVIKKLYKQAKEEIQRQELRKKMAIADAEVMDAYRRIQASRQKKKAPTKKKKVPTATLR